MGYRSDVKYVIVFPSIEKRDEFLVKQKMLGDKHIQKAVNELEVIKDRPIVRFAMDDVKWYDTYESVKAHHALMEEAEENFEAVYSFVRVGENLDDIEMQESNNTYIQTDEGEIYVDELVKIVRKVEFD